MKSHAPLFIGFTIAAGLMFLVIFLVASCTSSFKDLVPPYIEIVCGMGKEETFRHVIGRNSVGRPNPPTFTDRSISWKGGIYHLRPGEVCLYQHSLYPDGEPEN